MRIVEHYSHLNGLEYLMVHKPALWDEIQQHQMPRKFCHSLEDAKKKRCPRDLSSTCIADMCMAWRFPYGYPYSYVPNIHNQYILILQKPK